jgi:acyl carrier protein
MGEMQMMKETIKKFIVDYIEKKGKLPAGADLDSFDFVASGYIDSLALFKFVVDLEAEFGIEITDEEIALPEFRTIGGAAALISAKL